jgi:hypothetical protein
MSSVRAAESQARLSGARPDDLHRLLRDKAAGGDQLYD